MSRPRPPRTFPLEALLDWYGPTYRQVPRSNGNEYLRVAAPTAVLAELLGLSKRQVQRWKKHGLSLDDVEHVTKQLRVHPAEIWPYEWAQSSAEDVAEDVEFAELYRWQDEPGNRCFGRLAGERMGRRHRCAAFCRCWFAREKARIAGLVEARRAAA